MPRLSFLTTRLRLSVEASDRADGSLICAATLELPHCPHPGPEGALKTSSHASSMQLSLQHLCPHFTRLSVLNIACGAEPGQVCAAVRGLCGLGSGRVVPCSSAAETFFPWWFLGSQAVETSP